MKPSFILFLLISLMFSGCRIFQPKAVIIDKKDLEIHQNLIEASPDYYLEFVGLKNFTAEQIVDSMRAKQGNTITGARVLNACSAVMQRELGFEYSSTYYVNPNYGYITLIESKPDYGIVEKSLPQDSLPTHRTLVSRRKRYKRIWSNRSADEFLFTIPSNRWSRTFHEV
ncbi:MAG: hypothetical protein U5K71_02475 [Gracilimonas sp.]|nr:hypothetical protein [Gracilimonas sp.]